MNYEKLANTAKKLIEGAGRDVTVIKNSETLINSNKPWRGSTPGMSNANETRVECKAVFSGIELVTDKDNVQQAAQIAIVAAKSALRSVSGYDVEADLSSYDRVIDGSATWEVLRVDPVNPGPRPLLWKLYLKL